MLQNRSNIDETQDNTHGTSLHGTSFYYKEDIAQLILEDGTNANIKYKE